MEVRYKSHLSGSTKRINSGVSGWNQRLTSTLVGPSLLPEGKELRD
jgi:hypothetical protein